MIKLNDLLRLTEEQASIAKVRFNKYNGYENPIDIFKSNPDLINKQWLYWRNTNGYFRVGEIAICLVQISRDYWLLTTVDNVDNELGVYNGINYTGTPMNEHKGYFGRTIIKFHKSFQQSVRYFNSVADELEVSQILPDTFDDDDFPGYDRVKLPFPQLKSILDRGKRDWIAALESQKAVYLITDTNNGKLYVGSATGNNGMLLQRWRSYAENGHGGNKELKRIVESEGLEYIQSNFQYSILENYNAKVDDEVILKREAWWKDILQSRKFGYNHN
ncbi:GIY-YIG nuclease family protein [Alloscardovia criceti]|uniref:GIY-YIG nuclease family protein n=1 Tax=Alloscardovia criceti TaxID=356828 RepID=UPI00037D09D7|nr:GIY-YIG nuclease family protein [Alloscardovia criceti]